MDLLFIVPPGFALIAILLIAGIIGTKVSSHFNVPTLLMFMGVGMLAGLKIDFNNAAIANVIGTLAMCYILFSGGLDTNFRSIRQVMLPGIVLATLAVILTAIFMAIAAYFLLKCPLPYAFLLGCVVSSTDAAAVFSILRGRGASLKGHLQPLLELESGSNDPMAAVLTIFMVNFLANSNAAGFTMLLPMVLLKLIIGVGSGWIFGRAGVWLFNRSKLDFEGLYSVLGIAIVILVYGVTELIWGNGFMAVYATGLTMGSQRYLHKKALLKFHDGIAWLMQVFMFLVLGLLVTPKEFDDVAVPGLFLSAVLIFAARPLAVFISLAFSRYNIREKLLISWVGLRGAAPIVLATFPLIADIEGGKQIFNVIFFIVITSVLIQGKTMTWVARLLRLAKPLEERRRAPLELDDSASLENEMYEFETKSSSPVVGRSLAEIKFPAGTLVMLVRRNGHFVTPRGDTILQSGDGVLIMAEAKLLKTIALEYFRDNDFSLS